MDRSETRIEWASGWLLISVVVVPADDAGWLQAEIVAGLQSGQDPHQLLVWLPGWVGGHDAEIEIRADMAAWRRRTDNGKTPIAYQIVVRPGR